MKEKKIRKNAGNYNFQRNKNVYVLAIINEKAVFPTRCN